jgi:protease-4
MEEEAIMDAQKKTGCMQGCLLSVAIFIASVFGILILFSVALNGCVSRIGNPEMFDKADYSSPSDDCSDRYTEEWCAGVDSENAAKVVRIRLSGVIDRDLGGSLFNAEGDASSATGARNRIRAAKSDADVKAIILEVNSPGGDVTMSDLLWHELQEFKSSAPDRKVYAHLMDMACSGGYYVAVAADRIFALPTSLTGSIGVMIPSFNMSELAKKIGVEPVVIASSGNKDLLNPLAPKNPEHVAIMKKIVDDTYERFVEIVSNGRNLPKDIVRVFADGRVFAAKTALDNKLIDKIGYEKDLLDFVGKELGGEIKVVAYKTDFSLGDLFSADIAVRFVDGIKRAVKSEISPTSSIQYR